MHRLLESIPVATWYLSLDGEYLLFDSNDCEINGKLGGWTLRNTGYREPRHLWHVFPWTVTIMWQRRNTRKPLAASRRPRFHVDGITRRERYRTVCFIWPPDFMTSKTNEKRWRISAMVEEREEEGGRKERKKWRRRQTRRNRVCGIGRTFPRYGLPLYSAAKK